jgi:hypothetical protein
VSADSRLFASGRPHIYYTVRGGKKLLDVRLPYSESNKRYLQYLRNSDRRTNVTYNAGTRRWTLPASQYALLRSELLQKYGTIDVTIEGATLEKCTSMCANANPGTSDKCECVCLGTNHGQSEAGYKSVAEYLLVSSTSTSQTVRLTLQGARE